MHITRNDKLQEICGMESVLAHFMSGFIKKFFHSVYFYSTNNAILWLRFAESSDTIIHRFITTMLIFCCFPLRNCRNFHDNTILFVFHTINVISGAIIVLPNTYLIKFIGFCSNYFPWIVMGFYYLVNYGLWLFLVIFSLHCKL